VIGKLYADQFCGPLRPCDHLEVTAKIRFQRTSGSWTPTYTYRKVWNAFSTSREVKKRAPSGSYQKVRIRLYTFQSTALGPTGPTLREERNFVP
jgi:hypothetical protein